MSLYKYVSSAGKYLFDLYTRRIRYVSDLRFNIAEAVSNTTPKDGLCAVVLASALLSHLGCAESQVKIPDRSSRPSAKVQQSYIDQVCRRIDTTPGYTDKNKRIYKEIYRGIDLEKISQDEKEFLEGFSLDKLDKLDLGIIANIPHLDLNKLTPYDLIFLREIGNTISCIIMTR